MGAFTSGNYSVTTSSSTDWYKLYQQLNTQSSDYNTGVQIAQVAGNLLTQMFSAMASKRNSETEGAGGAGDAGTDNAAQAQTALDQVKQEISDKKDEIKEQEAIVSNPEKSIDASYDQAITTQESNVKTVTANRDKTKAAINEIYNLPQEEQQAKQSELSQLKAELEKYDGGEDVEGSVANAKKKLEDAKQAKTNAVNKAKTDAETKVTILNNELTTLEAKKKEIEETLDNLNDADGSSLNRTSEKDLLAKIKINTDDDTANDTEYDAKDLKQALHQYRKALQSGDKTKAADWKEKCETIYSQLSYVDQNSKEFTTVFGSDKKIKNSTSFGL